METLCPYSSTILLILICISTDYYAPHVCRALHLECTPFLSSAVRYPFHLIIILNLCIESRGSSRFVIPVLLFFLFFYFPIFGSLLFPHMTSVVFTFFRMQVLEIASSLFFWQLDWESMSKR